MGSRGVRGVAGKTEDGIMEDLDSCGIYCITCVANGKRYVGQTMVSFRKRWREHKRTLNGNEHRNIHLQRSWNKYSEHGFAFQILEACNTVEQCNEAEIFWIYTFRTLSREYGFNLRFGGNSSKHSEETKKRMSKFHTGLKHTNESKLKMSMIHIGKKLPMSTRIKMSINNTGRKQSNNTSGFSGVHWCQQKDKWQSRCTVNGKINHIGYFSDTIEAAKAYDRFAYTNLGFPCILNFPNDKQYKTVVSRRNKSGQNTSGYIGVSWNIGCNKWLVAITICGKRKHIGVFTDPILAAKAYDAASFAHYGRTDILNFPEDYTENTGQLCYAQ